MKQRADVPVAAPTLMLDRLAPWVRALTAQLAAAACVLLVAKAAATIGDTTIALAVLGAAQAIFAAAIGQALRLAPWWIPIQLGFTPIVLLATAARLPPGACLAAFLVLAGLYWSTYRTQVPLYPSSAAVWDAVVRLLPRGAIRFVDVGSGLGGLALHLAEARADSAVLGVELAPLPWLASIARARWRRSAARFRRIDYGKLDLGDFDVVFAFLSPAAMPALWSKARAEMPPGSLFLSLEFPVPDAAPDLAVEVPGWRGGRLCGWRMPSHGAR